MSELEKVDLIRRKMIRTKQESQLFYNPPNSTTRDFGKEYEEAANEESLKGWEKAIFLAGIAIMLYLCIALYPN
jgi:hypothetical protein